MKKSITLKIMPAVVKKLIRIEKLSAPIAGHAAPTLRSAEGSNRAPALANGLAVRRLTPRECERLQGFLVRRDILKNRQILGDRLAKLIPLEAAPRSVQLLVHILRHGKIACPPRTAGLVGKSDRWPWLPQTPTATAGGAARRADRSSSTIYRTAGRPPNEIQVSCAKWIA